MASTSKEGSKLDEQTKNSENAELQQPQHDNAKRPQKSTKESYAWRPPRVTKEELFSILAFWMGESPLLENQEANGVGAVLVKPDNKIFALDCSRKGLHGVTRLLMKFPRHAEGSSIYSSRKPCSLCTKLLVQCKVAKVFYLPIPPEKNDKDDIAKVDHLFKVSEVAQRVFIPNIDDSVLDEISTEEYMKKAKYSPINEDIKRNRENVVNNWMNSHWNYDEWVNTHLKENLPWLAFDEKMEKQVSSDIKCMFEWISFVAIIDPAYNVKFKKTGCEPQPQGQSDWQRLALHSTRLAKLLSHKTDDPKTGVGAVIMMDDENIVAIGWNGFPSKALYGDFPRASDSDKDVNEKKYPYVIHAEQNALLTRNKDNIRSESTTLFINKTPCNECVPLLADAGIKKVALPLEEKKPSDKSNLTYDLLYDKNFGFDIFVGLPYPLDPKSITPTDKVIRKVPV